MAVPAFHRGGGMRPKIAAFDVFNFTQRLACHLFPALPVTEQRGRTGDTLRGISDGEICLFGTPWELARACGEDSDEIEEFLQRHIGTLIRRDREIAGRIPADLKKRVRG